MRKRERAIEGEWMLVSQAEATLGLSSGALFHWMKRHGKWNKWTRRQGKYRIVSINALERYEAATAREGINRVSKRPQGWVGIYRAADLLESSPSTVWKAARKGNIRAVRVGHINWYHPGDCQAYRLELHNYPLPGWEQIKTTADSEGADASMVPHWLRHHGFEVRKHRRPTDKQVANYAREEALTAWVEYYRAAKENRRLSGQKLTLHQAREIRERSSEKRCDLAREYGVSEAAIYQIQRRITYKDAA